MPVLVASVWLLTGGVVWVAADVSVLAADVSVLAAAEVSVLAGAELAEVADWSEAAAPVVPPVVLADPVLPLCPSQVAATSRTSATLILGETDALASPG